MRKRSTRLYFTDLGSLAAYKCITKSLSFEYSLLYLSLALSKHRMQEIVQLTCQKQIKKPEKVPEVEFLANSMLLARLAELAQCQKPPRQMQEEVSVVMETERLLADAPVVPRVASLDDESVERP